MSEVDEDKNGIHSLGGFVFQIDVFLYYSLKLRLGETLEFESIEDVNIKKETDLDDKENSFRTIHSKKSSNRAIQVKRTAVTEELAKRILMNWILLEHSPSSIEEYILFVDSSYTHNGDIKNINSKDLYEQIIKTKDTSKKSLKKRLKDIFNDKFDEFDNLIKQIKSKYNFEQTENIENLLIDEGQIHFHKNGVLDAIYISRLESFRNKITNRIMEAIKKKNSCIIEFNDFMGTVEDINNNLRDEYPMISYSDHKILNPVLLEKIKHLREVKQLYHCALGEDGIKRRMHRCNYYFDYRYRLREISKLDKIHDLETTTFENFEDIKEQLLLPRVRLEQMENKDNSYAPNDNIRKGVCIYLTKEKDIVGDKQISWKDEDEK